MGIYAHALLFYAAARDIFGILVRVMMITIKGPYRPKDVLHYMQTIGVESLPIIIFSTAFAGIVVTSEIAYHMNVALHTVEMIPGFSGQFIFREVGIAIPALLLVAKVGASTTAEVGSMKVTEQIDALKLLHIDTVEYLVAPRFMACLIVFPCLTLLSILITLSCAVGVAVIEYGFSVLEYLNALSQFIDFSDLACAITKAVAFGAAIPVISCYYGFRCRSGAEGVGSATTDSVVTSTLVVIVLDFILSFVFAAVWQ